MGNVFRKRKNAEVNNVITKKDLNKYPHLDLKGEIIIKKDRDSGIAEIELNFEKHFPAFFNIWPKDFNIRSISPTESDISFDEIVINSKSL